MATPAQAEITAPGTGLFGRLKASERRLLGLFVLAVLGGLVFLASDRAEKASARNASAQATLDHARQALSRNKGPVADEVARAKAEVKGWSWTADNIDVGKVLVQSQVSDLVQKAGFVDADVKVSDKVQDAGDAKMVSLDIQAPFSWTALSSLMSGLEATGKGFVLDSVQVGDDDKPRMKLTLRAPLVLQTPPVAVKVKAVRP